jgi:antirestriction protein ArdC
MSTATTWAPTEHPRIGDGTFTDKPQSAPELTLADPFVDEVAETVLTKKYDTKQEKTQAFHEELEKHVAGLADDANWNDYLVTMSKFHRYSPFNQMLIRMQRPDATRVAGFKKWLEVERNVMRGQKGISIYRPITINATEEDANGNPVKGPDGKPVKRKKTVFGIATVFDVAQTEGKDLPVADDSITEDAPEGFVDDLEASIRATGYSVHYEDIPGGASGYTQESTKKVVVDAKLNAGDRARVLAHEHGHISCGHMDRDDYHTGQNGQRGAMEVEAESFAYVVCRAAGMTSEIGNSSATYVAGWSRAEPEAVKKSAETVAKAVKDVLGSPAFTKDETSDEPDSEPSSA